MLTVDRDSLVNTRISCTNRVEQTEQLITLLTLDRDSLVIKHKNQLEQC